MIILLSCGLFWPVTLALIELLAPTQNSPFDPTTGKHPSKWGGGFLNPIGASTFAKARNFIAWQINH